MKFAIIQFGSVVNLIVADTQEEADAFGFAVATDTATIGDVYNAETGEFTSPEPAVEDAPVEDPVEDSEPVEETVPAPTAKK